ncbi:MAG: putative glycoside hydrolase [bacterium]|nr:putative glycoside hydrolase [bacterium]
MWIPLVMVTVLFASGVHVAQDVSPAALPEPPVIVEPVRALYLTSGIAASARFDHFLTLLETTSVNALIIDLKDSDGRIAFIPTSDALRAIAPKRVTIRDLSERVDAIHRRGGLAIARIPVFQDSWYAASHPSEALQLPGGIIWRDRLGYAWLDPASAKVAQYAVDLAHESAALGFDEVNFDYIRFPSEGPRFREIRYPRWDGKRRKREVIRDFARVLDTEVRKKGIRTSADLFGQVLWNRDDLGIGQQLEELAPFFDILAPMVYPSHYRSGFLGHANPAAHPYEVIAATLRRGMERIVKLPEGSRPAIRPWLQDFQIGATYGKREVLLQQDASRDSGSMGWMLWNPRGRYTESALGTR